jgi:hypothetical protein
MICTTCKNEGVENEALGKKFYYCRACKVEITADEAPSPITPWGAGVLFNNLDIRTMGYRWNEQKECFEWVQT